MAPTRASHQVGAEPRVGSSARITRANTSIMATPTPVKTARLTSRTTGGKGRAALKKRLMGTEAVMARPPQLVVTRAARKVLLARSREPVRLLRIYRAGRGRLQAMPAAAVQARLDRNMRFASPW